jgi:hypothetical protein
MDWDAIDEALGEIERGDGSEEEFELAAEWPLEEEERPGQNFV